MAFGHLDELKKAEKYPIRWSYRQVSLYQAVVLPGHQLPQYCPNLPIIFWFQFQKGLNNNLKSIFLMKILDLS